MSACSAFGAHASPHPCAVLLDPARHCGPGRSSFPSRRSSRIVEVTSTTRCYDFLGKSSHSTDLLQIYKVFVDAFQECQKGVRCLRQLLLPRNDADARFYSERGSFFINLCAVKSPDQRCYSCSISLELSTSFFKS